METLNFHITAETIILISYCISSKSTATLVANLVVTNFKVVMFLHFVAAKALCFVPACWCNGQEALKSIRASSTVQLNFLAFRLTNYTFTCYQLNVTILSAKTKTILLRW